MDLLDGARTRRDVMKGALKGTAYAAPVVLSAAIPKAVAAVSPPLPTGADLALTKSVDIAAPTVGTNMTFTLLVNNRGPAPATGVVVSDPLPAGLTFVSSSTAQGAYAAATGLWTIGTLAAGARATLTLVATAATAGAKVNTATVRAAQGDPDLANNTANVTVTPGAAPSADLALSKTVDNATPNVGDTVTFTVTLTNNGPSAATGVQVTDALPAGLTFLSSVPSQGTYSAATGVWAVGSLANTASATLAIRARVATAGTKTNTATITVSSPPDPNAANNTATATVTPTAADLALAKTVDKPIHNSGENVTFTVTLTNNGPNTATGVVVNDLPPPDGVALPSGSPPSGTTYDETTGDWTISTLAAGASLQLLITGIVIEAPNGTVVTNTATVTHSDQFDPNAVNNTASASFTVENIA